MTPWQLATALTVVGLLVTFAALLSPRSPARRGPPPAPARLITPGQARRPDFPLTWRGYDPAHVDAFVDRLAAAYRALYAAADPEVITRAGEALAAGRGAPGDGPAPWGGGDGPAAVPPSASRPGG